MKLKIKRREKQNKIKKMFVKKAKKIEKNSTKSKRTENFPMKLKK